MSKIKKETVFAVIIVIAMLTWGGSWTSGKAIDIEVALEIVVFWRFFITFISFIPIILYLKPSLSLNKRGRYQVIIGAIFLVLYNFFFLYGLRYGLANEGGVIVTTLNPLFTFLISVIILKQSMKLKEAIGLFIGLIGGAILFQIWNIFNPSFLGGGDLLFLLAALSWALLSVITQKSKLNISPFVFSFYTYGLAALLNFILAIPKGVFDISEVQSITWINIFYLSLAATTFGTTVYFYAASQLGANKASSYTFLVPSSAVFFSWLILKEKVEWWTIIGGILALIAIYIINYNKKLERRR